MSLSFPFFGRSVFVLKLNIDMCKMKWERDGGGDMRDKGRGRWDEEYTICTYPILYLD